MLCLLLIGKQAINIKRGNRLFRETVSFYTLLTININMFSKIEVFLILRFSEKYLHRLFWNSKRQLCFFFSGEIKGFTSNHRREIWRLSNLQFWIWKLSLSLVDTFWLCETVYSYSLTKDKIVIFSLLHWIKWITLKMQLNEFYLWMS